MKTLKEQIKNNPYPDVVAYFKQNPKEVDKFSRRIITAEKMGKRKILSLIIDCYLEEYEFERYLYYQLGEAVFYQCKKEEEIELVGIDSFFDAINLFHEDYIKEEDQFYCDYRDENFGLDCLSLNITGYRDSERIIRICKKYISIIEKKEKKIIVQSCDKIISEIIIDAKTHDKRITAICYGFHLWLHGRKRIETRENERLERMSAKWREETKRMSLEQYIECFM